MEFSRVSASKQISWGLSYDLGSQHQFTWKVGATSSYWYQVKGCCKDLSSTSGDPCPPINPNSECKNKSQFFQVMLANSPEELCQELKDLKWDWKLCGLSRWSRPAENEFVDPNDQCNVLETIDFKKISECLALNIEYNFSIKINFKTDIAYGKCTSNGCFGPFLVYSPSNPFLYFRGRILPRFILKPTASGNLNFFGSTTPSCTFYSYPGNTTVGINGSANVISSSYKYVSEGSFTMSSDAQNYSRNLYSYQPEPQPLIKKLNKVKSQSGVILNYSASGSINFSNTNLLSYKFVCYPAGQINYFSSAKNLIKSYRYTAEMNYGSFNPDEYDDSFDIKRFINFSGYALLVSDHWVYPEPTNQKPVAAIKFFGSADQEKYFDYFPEGFIKFGEQAIVRWSGPKNNRFWCVGNGFILFSVNSESKNTYIYQPSGSIVLYSNYSNKGNTLGEYDIKIGYKSTVSIIGIQFAGENMIQNISYPVNDVLVRCKECSALPGMLYCNNNLVNLNIFNDFLNRNSEQLSENIPLTYEIRKNLWTNTLHYKDKYSSEAWKLVFDFGCINDFYDEANYYWKFALYVSRSLDDEVDFDSRLFLTIPSEFICQYKTDFSFSFKYNIIKDYLFVGYQSYYDNLVFYDNIGLFGSSYWANNPELKFTVSRSPIADNITRVQIPY